MIIAHPPCTYLSNSGVRWLYHDRKTETAKERWGRMEEARDFFMLFYNHPCPGICIENPIPHKHANLPKYSQIQPYDFFPHTTSKRTCLWLKGLPLLVGNQTLPKDQRTFEIHNTLCR